MPEWLKELLELGEIHRYQYYVEDHHNSFIYIYHTPKKIELIQKIVDRFVKHPFKMEVRMWSADTKIPPLQSIGRQDRL